MNGEHRPRLQHYIQLLGAPGAGVRTFSKRLERGRGRVPGVSSCGLRGDCVTGTVKELPVLGASHDVTFRLWDLPGRRYGIRPSDFCRSFTDAVIAFYDVTSDKSLQIAVQQLTQATAALQSLEQHPPCAAMFLVANKCDLLPPGSDAVPGIENGIIEAARLGAEFARSSSGPTPHVEQLLSRVVAAVYGKRALPDTTTVRGFGAKGGGARLPLRPPIARYQQPL